MDLDDIRLKMSDELNEDERKFLNEHVGELNDEEKEAYKDIITSEELPKGKEGEGEEEIKFKSQADFDKAVDAVVAKAIAQKEEERKTAEEEEKRRKETPPDDRFFPEGYQAKDWNEAAKEMYGKFEERFTKKQEQTKRETQTALEKINQEFDKEIEDLSAQDSAIPAKGTKERDEFDRELAEIGVEFAGVTNMTQAYKIYQALHTGKTKTEGVPESQRRIASNVGRSGGERTQISERKYKDIHGRTMDDLLDEELAKHGVKE